MEIRQTGMDLGSLVPVMHAPKAKIKLRPYQEESISATLGEYDNGVRRSMIVLPTGGGKTLVASDLTRRMQERGHGRVLFLAHREELIFQTVDKMRMVLGDDLDIGIVKAEFDEPDASIVVGSVQTLQNDRRLKRAVRSGMFGFVIVDEVHHVVAKSYRSLLEKLGAFEDDGPLLFGMTATPDRADKTGLGKVFESIAYEIGILDLIEQGYLVDIVAKSVELEVDWSAIRTSRGDYNAGDAGRQLMQSQAPDVIAQAMAEHAADRQSIVFVPTVEMAHATAAAINSVGLNAKAVSGMTPSMERRGMLAEMHNGSLQVLVNVGVLTEGTDIPSVDCCVMARPTKSRSLFVQMVGRALRTHMGKENALILDLVGGTEQHRLQTISTLFGVDPKKLKKKSVRQIKQEEAEQEEEGFTGKVVVRDVDIMANRAMHWVTTSNGQYVLSAGFGMMVLRYGGVTRSGEPSWEVWRVEGQGHPVLHSGGLSLEYAQGVAEDVVRDHDGGIVSTLTRRDAPWRNDPVTEKQLARCRAMKIPVGNIRTKGEASDAMSAADAMRRLSDEAKVKRQEGSRLWQRSS